MTKFVVSHINFYDNDLRSEIVLGDTWEDALLNSRFDLAWIFDDAEIFSLEEAKQRAFDGDSMINVITV